MPGSFGVPDFFFWTFLTHQVQALSQWKMRQLANIRENSWTTLFNRYAFRLRIPGKPAGAEQDQYNPDQVRQQEVYNLHPDGRQQQHVNEPRRQLDHHQDGQGAGKTPDCSVLRRE